jgi:hypothetical protein
MTSMADSQRESERKGVSSFKTGPEAAGPPVEMEQLVVTINPAMGTIVKVEKLDKAGKHQELSEEACAKLVGADEVEEIEAALEEAFEAGVAGVLGEEYETQEGYEDDEEKAIRRFLISDLLIPRSVRRRIMHRLLLSRMFRRRFLKHRLRQ